MCHVMLWLAATSLPPTLTTAGTHSPDTTTPATHAQVTSEVPRTPSCCAPYAVAPRVSSAVAVPNRKNWREHIYMWEVE